MVSSNGSGGGGTYAAISGDGLTVAFESHSDDLAPDHVPDSRDVFAYSVSGFALEHASVRTDGTPVYNPGEYTSPPAVSTNGRYVVFMSQADNLTGGDGNGMPDIFYHDRSSGVTKRASIGLNGAAPNGGSWNPAVSADGRYIAFQSHATNLFSGDNNDSVDIFVRDRVNDTTELISVSTAGQQGSDSNEYGFSSVGISGDGRYVVFSYDSLPVQGRTGSGVYLRDRQARSTTWIAEGRFPSISTDGRYIVFITDAALVSGDSNGGLDVYLYDRQNGSFERISVTHLKKEIPEQFISCAPDVSSDGRFIAYESNHDGIVPGDANGMPDIFIYDRANNTTRLVSRAPDGNSGNGGSHFPSISDSGALIAFESGSSNLVANDTNGRHDIFLYNLAAPAVIPGDFAVYMPFLGR